MIKIMSLLAAVSTVVLMFFRRKKYGISIKMTIFLLIVIGAIGYFGSNLASFLAFNTWSGIRFYGKTLLVSITLLVLSVIFKRKDGTLLDYYAPVDILALVVMKINCSIKGCCQGITLCYLSTGVRIAFPSQITELAVAALIFGTIMIMEHKSKLNGYRYYFYMISYGLTRFIFECLRIVKGRLIDLHLFQLSVAHIFCIVIVIIGGLCWYFAYRKNNMHKKIIDNNI